MNFKYFLSVSKPLDAMFDDRWIRHNGLWNWDPSLPDLTPLDFYLWDTLKEQIYRFIQQKMALENRMRTALA